ncbi:putative 2OG-Fe(II) oxygenase [Croceicoccus hydrothermalis]|uniref:putative 2OG-Fe(II) oxygenase n=1 Tax=Croceicoccus hydrothermalis TaxID=2867964 RepID=UPI001EFA90F2|nr:putative 2OG-Fe(II) oxygenase [Croceicoccus hydrothermalis]
MGARPVKAADLASLREQALAAERAGDGETAMQRMAHAVRLAGDHAALLNSAGGLALRLDRREEALAWYRQAFRLRPDSLEYATNLAIALHRFGRHDEALSALSGCECSAHRDARYFATRGHVERALSLLDEAAKSYDHALSLKPDHARAMHGRARIALERADADVVARYEAALRLNANDPETLLGYAQALEITGRNDDALALSERLNAAAPRWTDALAQSAQLRLARGDDDFTAPYQEAVLRAPDDAGIRLEWARQLAGLDLFAEAADVAAKARRDFPDNLSFALLEAVHAGEAGDDARAGAIFAALPLQSATRDLHEARHWIRLADPERAEALLLRVLDERPFDIGAWALRSICWRLTQDRRLEWLHGQNTLVQRLPLPLEPESLRTICSVLHALHERSSLPLGQSVRGGSQTRGRLFARSTPEIRTLHDAVMQALACYREALPDRDDRHPLLRYRDAPWRTDGSWSVRLNASGFHAAHIHPKGCVSSAIYLELPDTDGAESAGWLELGRPPSDLRLDLPPERMIEPRCGHLVLFPSTLYHGTRPFEGGQRMTVAFDVVPR